MPRPRERRVERCALIAPLLVLLAAILASLTAQPAVAHGFSSVVYANLTSDETGRITAELQLEYDLLVVSAADMQQVDQLFRDGTAAFERADTSAQAKALQDHMNAVESYVTERFTITTASGQSCQSSAGRDVTMTVQQGVPYAVVTLDYTCASDASAHEVTATLFPDDEGYVRDTETIVTYELDGQSGSAALSAQQPLFSTEQSAGHRFVQFFTLGAEHLLTGIDHILFLLALIAGSRRLREVILAASAFTLAHSVTFILAATGVVKVPDAVVEPVIALSISLVAAWYLWLIWQRRAHANELDRSSGPIGIDRAGWLRLGVVFCFGLIHGLGFAGALGIDEPWSWTLLWSLLVFNLGIEAVQVGIIVMIFPLLALLRRRAPQAALWVTGGLAALVAITGLYWFVERVVAG